jgi:hypothetical protein
VKVFATKNKKMSKPIIPVANIISRIILWEDTAHTLINCDLIALDCHPHPSPKSELSLKRTRELCQIEALPVKAFESNKFIYWRNCNDDELRINRINVPITIGDSIFFFFIKFF